MGKNLGKEIHRAHHKNDKKSPKITISSPRAPPLVIMHLHCLSAHVPSLPQLIPN